MKQVFIYTTGLCLTVAALCGCGNRDNETDGKETPDVNVSDSRRNTPGSVNTITGDSNKVASDSDQHEIRDKNREGM